MSDNAEYIDQVKTQYQEAAKRGEEATKDAILKAAEKHLGYPLDATILSELEAKQKPGTKPKRSQADKKQVKKQGKVAKRLWWFKMDEQFFQNLKLKKLRRLEQGDTLFVIYLRLLLFSLQNWGILAHQGIEESIVAELALELDALEEDIETAWQHLLKLGLIEQLNNKEYVVAGISESIGSETGTAEYMRNLRAQKGEAP